MGVFTEDGTSISPETYISGKDGIEVNFSGDFGGGTVTVQHFINGGWEPLQDENSANITYSDVTTEVLGVLANKVIRFVLTSATSPNLFYDARNGEDFLS